MGHLLQMRARLGAKWMVVLLLLAPTAFGVWHFGPRAALVVGTSVAVALAASVLPRRLDHRPHRWINPGTLITGLLLGLTLSPTTPLYMAAVGALVAELPGKARLPGLRRNLLNPAAFGRAAVALLETVDPPAWADAATGASVLFKEAGGHGAPLLADAFLGLTRGAIGETSALTLALVAVPMLTLVVVKRQAPLAMLVSAPLLVALLPATPEIAGHAPWALDPVVYLSGSALLLNAVFFATDPATTPNTRLGGVAFGVGAAAIGVLGRTYTTIPGAEMYGILAMNLAAPGLDAAVRRWRGRRPAPASPGFFEAIPPAADRVETLPPGTGLRLLAAVPAGAGLATARADAAGTLAAVRASDLRGRGGAGFPAADKWAAALSHSGPRVLVVNAQEGEPDTFKDRYLVAHHADQVMEGVAIAAGVIGAGEVHVVVDPTFLLADPTLRAAEAALRARSGDSALPPVVIHRGPGLYVCGEETALLSWLEGGRGEPRPRPPYPTERGLRGLPTVVHNVETLVWLPAILHRSTAWFRAGGWRLVTLSGAVRRPGVYEVPRGATLGEVLALGGGMASGRRLGAFAVGGPSGGLVPPTCADAPFDAAALSALGAPLGTASVRVLDDATCVVREVLHTARFFREESCGRCTPCRVGTAELARRWAGLAAGSADTDGLQTVAEALGASICGLGTGAAHRLQSVLRHWPEAVRAHAEGGSCDTCRSSS